jgi:hypothetical protein
MLPPLSTYVKLVIVASDKTNCRCTLGQVLFKFKLLRRKRWEELAKRAIRFGFSPCYPALPGLLFVFRTTSQRIVNAAHF